MNINQNINKLLYALKVKGPFYKINSFQFYNERNDKYSTKYQVMKRLSVEKLYMKSNPENWFVVSRTATQPDALQGFYAEHSLYIIDEASGVKDIVFKPVLVSLSTQDAKLIMCKNSTQLSGFF